MGVIVKLPQIQIVIYVISVAASGSSFRSEV